MACSTGCGRSPTRSSLQRCRRRWRQEPDHRRRPSSLRDSAELPQRNAPKPDGRSVRRPYERVMMTFVNMEAPGLVVLPTHRVVFGLENFSILEMVPGTRSQYFEVEDSGASTQSDRRCSACMQAGTDRTALLAVTSHGGFLLFALDGRAWTRSSSTDLSERQRALDVVHLHKLVAGRDAGHVGRGHPRPEASEVYARCARGRGRSAARAPMSLS